MGAWSGLVWYGANTLPFRLKSLLVTGDFPNHQFWVGGDRPTPFGPLPLPVTNQENFWPKSIMSTGPGLDDWVVCYHSNNTLVGPGTNVAFADSTGIIKTRAVPLIAGDNVQVRTLSKGLFASHRVLIPTQNASTSRFHWTSVTSENADALALDNPPSTPTFVLPDQMFLEFSIQGVTQLDLAAIPNHDLTFAFTSRNTTPKTQTIYPAVGSRVNITPPIDAANLAFFSHTLIGTVLYRNLFISVPNETGTVTLTANRWGIEPASGTWVALSAEAYSYHTYQDFLRVDSSYSPLPTP